MKRHMALSAVLATFMLASGCTASKLSNLRDEYNQVMQERQACLQTDKTVENCIAADRDRFLEIGKAASKKAQEAGATTKVSLYALAAEAMRETGPDGRRETSRLSDLGLDICKNPPANVNPGPRDCALLFLIPVFAEHDALVPTVDDLKRQNSSTGTRQPDFETTFESVSSDFRINVWRELKTRAPKALGVPKLPESVKSFVVGQSGKIYCTHFQLVEAVAPGITPRISAIKRNNCGSGFDTARQSDSKLTEATFRVRCEGFDMFDDLNAISRKATGSDVASKPDEICVPP